MRSKIVKLDCKSLVPQILEKLLTEQSLRHEVREYAVIEKFDYYHEKVAGGKGYQTRIPDVEGGKGHQILITKDISTNAVLKFREGWKLHGD